MEEDIKYTKYFKSGLIKEQFCSKDKGVEVILYYKDGQIEWEKVETRIGELLIGVAKYYYKNAQIESEVIYVGRIVEDFLVEDGLSKWYDEKGNLIQKLIYKR